MVDDDGVAGPRAETEQKRMNRTDRRAAVGRMSGDPPQSFCAAASRRMYSRSGAMAGKPATNTRTRRASRLGDGRDAR